MQAVVLAAGKGTRLHPITSNRTKAMVPIVGKPIVERVMETLSENGIRDFILVISQEDDEIKRYFQEQSNLDANVQYVVQPERLGMANALMLAAPYIRDAFVLSACDNLVSSGHIAELLTTHRARDLNATLSLMKINLADAGRTGVVEFQDGSIRRIVEKPAPGEAPSNTSSLPLYVFSRKLLEYLPQVRPSPRGEYELQDAIQMLIDRDGQVSGVLTETRLQLTNASDLLALNRHYLLANQDRPHLKPLSLGQHARLVAPLRIEEGTIIGPGGIVGPRVFIERDCRIGADVLIEDAVILRGATVEDGRHVIGEVIT